MVAGPTCSTSCNFSTGARNTSQRPESAHQPFGDWFMVTARIALVEKHLQQFKFGLRPGRFAKRLVAQTRLVPVYIWVF